MHLKYVRLASITALMMGSATALALPFNSFDTRSMGMGGTGVAIGDPSTAPFYNPALLSASDPSHHSSIEFPIIGARLYDPDVTSNLSTLSTDINTLNTSLSAVTTSANGTAAQLAQLPANMTTLANDIDKVNTLLATLNNKPLQGEFGAATVVSVPNQDFGFAFYADAWGAMGGTLEYNDGTTLSGLSTSVRAAATALSSASAACARVQAGTGTSADVTTCIGGANGLVNANGAVNFNTNSLASKIHIRGVLIREIGMSISHSFVTNDQEWALGITPKSMQLSLYDAKLDANSGGSGSGATGSDYMTKYSDFNFDLGVAKSYLNGWRTGVVVKNVIPKAYNFMSIAPGAASGSAQQVTGSLNVKPLVRAGVSHENAWSTVAFDLDLTKNDPAGLENNSQFAALGAELSALGWAQIRAGYRADLINPVRNVTSIGLGISPRVPYFKFHFDLAYAYNANENGASFQFGFNF